MSMEQLLALAAVLIFVSVVSSKISDKFAIPVLLIFLAVGMLAGSEGIGGIFFNDTRIAKSIGVIALIFIIFSGGFDTDWKETKPVLWHGVLLSTVGVFITAVITGFFAMYALGFSLLEGMLLGSIVSSTDAAAVFSILRSRNISLKPPLKALLEFESGSNDPMAVFLTLGIIGIITSSAEISASTLILKFLLDMGAGALIGYLMARFSIFFINFLKLEYEGLYPVIMISLVLLTYSAAVIMKGNGFLAVYIAGLMLGKSDIPNKKMIMRFHDGIAWLMQIVMFVTLGLLVFPSKLIPLAGVGMALTMVLMFVARPVSVFLLLIPFKLSMRMKTMVAWTGLRGSVPIILATFPLMANISRSSMMFNIVFFVVIASVLIQGMSIPFVSKILKVNAPFPRRTDHPIEFERKGKIDADLTDIIVPYESEAIGKKIGELLIPKELLIVLISRNGKYVIPSGDTTFEAGDVLLVLASDHDFAALSREISRIKKVEKTRDIQQPFTCV